MLEYFSISDIKKIFVEKSLSLIVGEQYDYRGHVYQYMGIKNRVLMYTPKFEPMWVYGIFYELKHSNGMTSYFTTKPNPKEWQRVHKEELSN
jgi:hypothetical protein